MFGENSRGLIWHLRILIFRFPWKLPDEERPVQRCAALHESSLVPRLWFHECGITVSLRPAWPG